jgi:hypothetical protein
MGIKGSATCTLSFGDNGDCRGWLLGDLNKGLSYMFQLMNEARINTGMQATGMASNAYQHALQYAKDRLQGRNIMEKDPNTPQLPIIRHADVRRMLLVQKAVTEGVFALLIYSLYLNDIEIASSDSEEKEKAKLILDVLTPVCKAYGSEASYEAIVQSIQCHGGYGFSEEFPMAQMLRDTKVFPIYEGTNYIQSMDLLGRKVVMKNGAALFALLGEMQKTMDEANGIDELKDLSSKLDEAVKEIGDITQHLGGIALNGDVDHFLYFASYYLKAFSVMVISWLFLWQSLLAYKALKAGAKATDQNFYKGKVATARFYYANEMPHLHANIEIMKNGDRTAIEFKEEWF